MGGCARRGRAQEHQTEHPNTADITASEAPAMPTAAMRFSSLSVIGNLLRLRRARI